MSSTKEMLALLDALKTAAQAFAAREEKLNRDFQIRSGAESGAFEAATQNQEAELCARIAEAEAALLSEKERQQARFEQRKARLNQAHFIVRKRVMEGVSNEEGRRKYKIQEGTLEAERQRGAGLANAITVLSEFNQKAAEMQHAFTVLERTARKHFRGGFRGLLAPDKPWPGPDLSPDENKLFDELQRLHAKTGDDLNRFKKIFLPQLFRFFPVWLSGLLLLGFAAAVRVLQQFGIKTFSWSDAGIAAGAFVVLLALYFCGRRQGAQTATAIAGNLAKARRMLDACFAKAAQHCQQEQQRVQDESVEMIRQLNQRWRETVKGAIDQRGTRPMEVDEQASRLSQKARQLHHATLEQLQRTHAGTGARLRQEAEADAQNVSRTHSAKMAKLKAGHQAQWSALETEWKNRVQPIYDAITRANAEAAELFPDWQSANWENWKPPHDFKNAAKFAQLDVDVTKLAEAMPKDPRLALPGPASFSVPLALACPREGSILFETTKGGDAEAVASINNIIFRLLSTTPPGKISFTIFDPVGLGQNFAALMHLADYEESSINSRIWTQQNQFEEKLAELNEHMEKVIQMYLRNEYETIAEYNAQAGSIAEKYHFLVIASLPVNFSDTAARRLRNIAASGARCGVYTLIHWDHRHPPPQDFVPDELRKNSVRLDHTETGFELADWRAPGIRLLLDPPPPPEFVTKFLHDVGESSRNSGRVEVPFEQVAPPDGEVWTEDTTEELRVPIGRSGATKLQYLEIGKGTRQHGLIAGKTGSGKSTLFHVIITNLALWCSPEQVEFYLVDFKKGVEFKCYASRRLPHARVVAIESDRQFGLSVLQRVDEELRRRGDLFRKLGVQDVAGYKHVGGAEPMPRSLLLIDEFQEFFTEEDHVSQSAAVLLDRIVRQGRAFGIHVVLGSQTLGGAYTLARATLGQMVIRIALQCNEADAYLIMDQDNPAPRLLSRPGEGIYNDAAGAIEGNSPFQAVWLPEKVRDEYLAKVRERADKSPKKFPEPFVFEGNAPADVRENVPLNALLQAKEIQPSAQARIWLGSPNSIKGPTEAVFQRQSGSNLIVVGQSEERTATMLSVALISLAAQYPKGSARFVLLDSAPPGDSQREFLCRVIGAVPHEIIQATNSNLQKIMSSLAADLKRQSDEEQAKAPETFVLVHGLQNFKKLRQEDEFSFSSGGDDAAVQPAAVFLNLITDGPSHGFHVIATCDSYNNVTRFLGRKNLGEFELRVLFQMSAADSASLIDSPDAATLGLHRALYYNDREGYTETFRPYALPGNQWIEEASRQLKRLLNS